ncbi:winged helix DNA-binding domain-containing protein [Arthrobacter sp. STN4]|uniref:winged helix DNA-binding domain-containing protein n=1 Tax=Arthrobacter sp. STN4 TaxID=2923276 RepID=UPI002119B93A|nr:winged helix DNA-binding domain-containing protein [Arthrobacter sp. STN4]MCQ9164556.1 winged helix DNA-binding domain-containing protein [Arthrobacter sp. STN4]
MTPSLTPAKLARLRLAAQWILPASSGPAPGPVDAVRRLTALQGQDFPGALWSIGLRAPGTTRSDVEAAFNRGELVRSCPLRGTLHVTVAQDLGWILSLTAERMMAGQAARHRQLDITTPDVEQVRGLALALLEQSGGRATREELFAAFEQAGQGTRAQRGYHLLFLLSLDGTLVQGPVNGSAGNGNSQFYVNSAQWIRNPRTLDRREALAELALRYFRGHGPSTVRDFQWWSKLTLADIKAGLEYAKEQLEAVECGGDTYWLAPETADLLGGSTPGGPPGARSVLLLPGFDEYLLGYTDRSAALAPRHAPLTVPGNNGMFKATVVAGGQVAGTWRKARGAAGQQRPPAGIVVPECFTDLGPNQHKSLEKSAKAYAKFIGT